MQKYRSYVLPAAIVLGLLLHKWCAMLNFLVPFLIFSILLLTFCAVDIKKLRMNRLDVWLMLFQIVVSLGSYLILKWFGTSDIVAQGVLIGVLCPVASSVAVISCMLGANRETVTAYTIIGNLMVAVVAPVYFSFIGTHQDMPFLESFWMILKRISIVLGLPFFAAWAIETWLPRTGELLRRYKGLSFYLWALALLLTLQFGFGRWLGGRYGDKISGGQLLGQKNTAMGIWMAGYYLTPLASVFLAFYSVFQNVWNSWQMWQVRNKNEEERV